MKDTFFYQPEGIAALSKQEQYLNEAREHNQVQRILESRRRLEPPEEIYSRPFECCSDHILPA